MASSLLEELAAGRAPAIEPINVTQYHKMVEKGILHEGAPIELIDGLLVRKDRSEAGSDPMTHGTKHAISVTRFQRFQATINELSCHLRYQLPVTLTEFHEPEPDIAIIRGRLEDYLEHHPGPADIVAAIEVADSSLDYDRTTKQRLYASADIPVYWIVNIPENKIEVYESPNSSEGRYNRHTELTGNQMLRIQDGETVLIEIAAEDVLP